MPLKKGRQTSFKSLVEYDMPVIFYEAPHRKVIVARELIKMFEEVVTCTPEEVFEYFTQNPEHIRGEFVVLIDISR